MERSICAPVCGIDSSRVSSPKLSCGLCDSPRISNIKEEISDEAVDLEIHRENGSSKDDTQGAFYCQEDNSPTLLEYTESYPNQMCDSNVPTQPVMGNNEVVVEPSPKRCVARKSCASPSDRAPSRPSSGDSRSSIYGSSCKSVESGDGYAEIVTQARCVARKSCSNNRDQAPRSSSSSSARLDSFESFTSRDDDYSKIISRVSRRVARKSCRNPRDRAPINSNSSRTGETDFSSSWYDNDSFGSPPPPQSRRMARKSCGSSNDRAPSCEGQSYDSFQTVVDASPPESRRVARKRCDRTDERAPCLRTVTVRCKLCRTHLVGKRSLRRHVRQEHRTKDKDGKRCEPSHQCASCSRRFTSSVRLWKHTWLVHIGAAETEAASSAMECHLPLPAPPTSKLLSENDSVVFGFAEATGSFISGGNHKSVNCSSVAIKTKNVNDDSTQLVLDGSLLSRSMSTANVSRKHFGDDSYLYCDDCKEEYQGDCPVHGPMYHITDTEVVDGDPMRADNSIPDVFRIGKSGLTGAGLGIFAQEDLQKRTMIGPYMGRVVARNSKEALTSEYVWEIKNKRKTVHCIDGKEVAHSNWMRYINCANNYQEQNLTAFQYNGQIFYKTIKPVKKGMELLVWYGSAFGKVLGLLPERQKRTKIYSDGESVTKKRKLVEQNNYVQCKQCGKKCSSSGYLGAHVKAKHDACKADKENGNPSIDGRESGKIKFETDSVLDFDLTTKKKKYHFHKPLVHTAEVPRPFKCLECNTAYKQLSHFTEHQFHTHGVCTLYKCIQCQCRFDFFRDLVAHQKNLRHKGRDRIKVQSDVDVQVLSVSADSSDGADGRLLSRAERLKPHVCSWCFKRFKTIFNLRTHHSKAHGIKVVYQCKKCLVEFTMGFQHLRAHQAESGHRGITRILVGPSGEYFQDEHSNSGKRAKSAVTDINASSGRLHGEPKGSFIISANPGDDLLLKSEEI